MTVTISGHEGSDITLSVDSLTFTAANWDTPQTVTVNAAEDADAAQDETVTLTHAITGAEEYAAVTADDVEVTITERNTAGVSIDPTELTVAEGDSNSYTVVLTTRCPGADVTVVTDQRPMSINPTALTREASSYTVVLDPADRRRDH